MKPALFISLLILAACTDAPTADNPETSAPQTRSPAAELVFVNYDQWEEARSSLQPDIVVVDLWASWCVPCLERFPEMINLHHKYADDGVRFVSLSLDDREDPSGVAFARKFLVSQNPPFPSYFLNEDILDGFEKLDILGIPAVDIYGRDGKLAMRLTSDNPGSQFTEHDVEQAVITLLNK